uniref:Uncharacterized protein n=1 Tax=Strigamia maritima TaxID=126957 RepID=T1ILK3_STRMM
MLRTHFRHSQHFIVVLLKDGMFNNANVLYKTKFVDGMFTVTHNIVASSRADLPSMNKRQSSFVINEDNTNCEEDRTHYRGVR